MKGVYSLARGLVVALVTAATAACGVDSVMAPAAASRPIAGLRTNRWSPPRQADAYSTEFVVRPDRDTKLKISGGHFVSIPAGAICDLAASGYGPDVWETPCAPQRQSLTITVNSGTDAAGHPHVQFSPELRFTPDDSKLVWLVMQDSTAAQDTSSRIVFCPTPDGECVDESVADRDLDTRFDAKTQQLYRRLKHFGGYKVLARDGSVVQ